MTNELKPEGKSEKFTEGNWEAKPIKYHIGLSRVFAPVYAGDEIIAEVQGATLGQAQSRAHLAAAAPDMYQALKDAREALGNAILMLEPKDEKAIGLNAIWSTVDAAISQATPKA